ncbi:MAG: PD40 domain-containing protein, partial [Bacteroidales bacterium]|nr:PD40 domain-containing protein [Bacteroidales bacterium]
IFESKKNDNYDLWYIDPNKKGGIVQITSYEGPDRVPCPHPDGKRYVFLSDRSETGYYLGELGKSTVMSLVEAREPNVGLVTSGSISPDGRIFLYVSGKYIWTFDFETKTKTQFIQGTEPRWTPDGKKIIFRKVAKEITTNAGTTIVSTSIWMMNPDGSETTEVIAGDNNFTYSGASISPDGTKILYLKKKVVVRSSGVDIYYPDIWICKIDGTDHTQITTNPLSDQEAVWIDNQTIIFASDRPQSGNYDDRKWDLWKAKVNQ